jgi:hypothetical protein
LLRTCSKKERQKERKKNPTPLGVAQRAP